MFIRRNTGPVYSVFEFYWCQQRCDDNQCWYTKCVFHGVTICKWSKMKPFFDVFLISHYKNCTGSNMGFWVKFITIDMSLSSRTSQLGEFPFEDELTTNLPANLPPHCTQSWLNKTSNDIAGCLKQYGIAVVNNFLGTALGDQIYTEVGVCLHDIQPRLFVIRWQEL